MSSGGAELAIIVPTFNERENITPLLNLLRSCLRGISWEVIFVDDNSPDGTADHVRQFSIRDVRIRCIQRIGRRGLSSACVEGMLATSAPYLAVMDGDMQHDETLLPKMLEILRQEDIEVVVGSRYIDGGGVGDWDASRAAISRLAVRLSKIVVRADLNDPMSGFFMIRREVLHTCAHNLSTIGFKILLDIFASSPRPLRFRELPYIFRTRQAGESKLDSQATWDYLMLLLDKWIGHVVPVRFVSFSIVGGMGVLVHFLVLTLLFRGLDVSFVASQTTATLVAMSSNFVLNNLLTYRDMRLRGWGWLRGWISFALACSLGALANVAVAFYLFEEIGLHWIWSALVGVIIAAVWNYAVTMIYTWKNPKSR